MGVSNAVLQHSIKSGVTQVSYCTYAFIRDWMKKGVGGVKTSRFFNVHIDQKNVK
jgi:hypothetical protein